MRLAQLAGVAPSAEVLACYRRLDADAPDDYRQLAALLADRWRRDGVVKAGIGGGQGAGKSTLGRLLVAAGERLGVRIAVLGLDDFYLAKAARRRLAQTVHPLLATRGPPGTHEVDRLRETLDALRRPGAVQVPRFDKGRDERAGFETLRGPCDIAVLEGWCVGATPAPAEETTAPINALERQSDADGRWRRFVDAALGGGYAALRADLASLAFLQAPDLAAVRRWRLRQERDRPAAERLTAAEVRRFVQHYERVTLRMLSTLPNEADIVARLDGRHRVRGLRLR